MTRTRAQQIIDSYVIDEPPPGAVDRLARWDESAFTRADGQLSDQGMLDSIIYNEWYPNA